MDHWLSTLSSEKVDVWGRGEIYEIFPWVWHCSFFSLPDKIPRQGMSLKLYKKNTKLWSCLTSDRVPLWLAWVRQVFNGSSLGRSVQRVQHLCNQNQVLIAKQLGFLGTYFYNNGAGFRRAHFMLRIFHRNSSCLICQPDSLEAGITTDCQI